MGSAFDSIQTGLSEAVHHARGDQVGIRIYRPEPVDVAALRHRVGMTQKEFAARFGVSVATLRHWERGDRKPQGPALVLLNLIHREPEAILRLLDRAGMAA